MPQRDYALEMLAVFNAETEQPGWNAVILASSIVNKLRATDPDLLRGYLDSQAEDIIRQALGKTTRSQRGRLASTARGSAFAAAAKKHTETGDDEVMAPFRQTVFRTSFTVQHGERKELRVLDHGDLIYVADTYRQRYTDNLVWARFMQALARKVTTGTVQDHYTEDQILAMFGDTDRQVRAA